MSTGQQYPGRFITFEGGEGAGKSSQLATLAAHLRDAGYRVRTTREPGGTGLGEAVRSVLMADYEAPMPAMTELLLVFAARAAHLEQVIEPAIAAGEIVLCDRFTDASFAYQGRARGLGDDSVAVLEKLVQDGRRPNGVLVLDLPVEEGLARAGSRGSSNRFDDETLAFHIAVREGYLARAALDLERYAVIDAAPSPAEVAQRIETAVQKWL